MNEVYTGKTKDVYALDNGNYMLQFKDDMTGEDGVFDPGANTVGLSIEGAGKAGLRLTTHFFKQCRDQGIPTHFIETDIDRQTMTVVPATVFGEGLEVICRFRATGSFIRRYGKYAVEGQPLDAFVEVTLKDDERGDPPISRDALDTLSILTKAEYSILKDRTQKIATLVKNELAEQAIDLYDIKLEFGRDQDGEIVLIDEISGGNMRAFKDGVYVAPLELAKMVTKT
ncbi:phosphoribosylaminoimidazolesuccinocarboxamide synthase [Lentibacillus halophilus]|uniref:Phosphoribosylaminoimidazole-succinocarboxamide synthase n=1 Tax=Lentibacillus halophilus TaxID=295065 RepID=A0ABP3J395_9BACI